VEEIGDWTNLHEDLHNLSIFTKYEGNNGACNRDVKKCI
jgi:hypothetical protein